MSKKFLSTILIAIIILFLTSTVCLAVNPSKYRNASTTIDGGKITDIGSAVFSVVRIVGAAISVIYISILGIKYMTSSVDDRASIKKQLVPFVIGAAIFFGISFIMQTVIVMSGWIQGNVVDEPDYTLPYRR